MWAVSVLSVLKLCDPDVNPSQAGLGLERLCNLGVFLHISGPEYFLFVCLGNANCRNIGNFYEEYRINISSVQNSGDFLHKEKKDRKVCKNTTHSEQGLSTGQWLRVTVREPGRHVAPVSASSCLCTLGGINNICEIPSALC